MELEEEKRKSFLTKRRLQKYAERVATLEVARALPSHGADSWQPAKSAYIDSTLIQRSQSQPQQQSQQQLRPPQQYQQPPPQQQQPQSQPIPQQQQQHQYYRHQQDIHMAQRPS